MKTKKRIKKLEKAVNDLQQIVASLILQIDPPPIKGRWKLFTPSTGSPIDVGPTITSGDRYDTQPTTVS